MIKEYKVYKKIWLEKHSRKRVVNNEISLKDQFKKWCYD